MIGVANCSQTITGIDGAPQTGGISSATQYYRWSRFGFYEKIRTNLLEAEVKSPFFLNLYHFLGVLRMTCRANTIQPHR